MMKRFLYLNLLFWLFHSLFFALKEISALPLTLVLTQFGAFFVGGFSISCFYHFKLRKLNLYRGGIRSVIKLILMAIVPLALIVVLYDTTLDKLHYNIGFHSDPMYRWVLAGYFVDGLIVFSPWFLLYHCYQYGKYAGQIEKDNALKEVELGKAKLRSLLHKLNPHFLFNTLNTIRWLIISDPGKARLAVDHLSEILRYTTKVTEELMIPISMELEIVERYLKMECTRFENLEFKITCDDRLIDFKIPPFLVLNLVENAITHGISHQANGAMLLEVEVFHFDKKVEIRVINTGALQTNRTGFGLESIGRMLLQHFGPEAQLTVRQDEKFVISTASISTHVA